MNSFTAEVQSPEQILNSAAIIVANPKEETQSWIKLLLRAGAREVSRESTDEVIKGTAQKIAIIINETDTNVIQEIIDEYEERFAGDPGISLRYIYLFDKDNNDEPNIKHPKFRAIDYLSIAPRDFAKKINGILNKARLPEFLRIGYHIEISDTDVREVNGILYRKIRISSFKHERIKRELESFEKGTKPSEKNLKRKFERTFKSLKDKLQRTNTHEIEDESTHLYIHNKCLYEISDNGQVKEIRESQDILIFKWGHTGPVNLSSLRNTETEE